MSCRIQDSEDSSESIRGLKVYITGSYSSASKLLSCA